MSSQAPEPVQKHLAEFEIVRRLGAGGMAEVFVAKKRGAEGTYKVVVVKRILPSFGNSRRFRSMFIDEAMLATRLNHPNVVQVYEFSDRGDEGHILAMELVEGCDLGQLMTAARASGRRIDPYLAAWIIAEAAKGLHYAHEKRDDGGTPLEIVHRDVSPQNVLLSYDGAVKIADFGIASARFVSEEEGTLKGKYGYMSPEQARGERVDRRSDLYALGVILWEAIVGAPLHGGLGGEALLDVVRSGIVDAPSQHVRDLPEDIEAIVMKLLSPDPADRFATGRELVQAVGRALLAQQVLVDSTTLETCIEQLVGRSLLSAEMRASAIPLTAADVPQARQPSMTPPEERVSGSMAPAPREVRHVAVVTLRLLPKAPLDAGRRDALIRALERWRATLTDMAYKRGTRWVWLNELSARATVGLSSRPARAAVDAAGLALDTHEALSAIVDDLPVPLGASISIVRGIASGFRDGEGNLVRHTIHDPAPLLADALGSVTPMDSTWVAGGVYRLVRRDFRWGDAPELDLTHHGDAHNLPSAMRVYSLERSLSREERDAERATSAGDIVGRSAERGELQSAFHACVSASGGGRMTSRVVVGEIGIGKTALVQEFVDDLPPNARLVRAECSPARIELPHAVLTDLIRDFIGATGEEPFDEVAERIASVGGGTARGDASSPMVARLAEIATGSAGRESGDDDSAFRKKEIVDGVRNLFASVAIDHPLVVVIEGLQWADRQSMEIISALLKAPDPLPILILLVTRPDDRIAAQLEGQVRVELRGLSPDEQIQLVERRLNVTEGVRAICEELLPRVGGNPLYLLEIVDALLEKGSLEIRGHQLSRTEDAERHLRELPSTLEQLLADRLHELPLAEHAVVDWLAVAGGPLRMADLVALSATEAWVAASRHGEGATEASAIVVDDAVVARLCARGLCERRADVIDLRHLLTRDVAYAALAPAARVRMHRALGEHLSGTSHARGLQAAIVARHLARGEARTQAAGFYLEAAETARVGYQTQLATRYYTRALATLPAGDPREFIAHAALESIYRALGRRRDRVKHLDALRRLAGKLSTHRTACVALMRTARFELDEQRIAKGLAVAEQAAHLTRQAKLSDLEVEAELLLADFLRESGDVHGGLAASDRALAAIHGAGGERVSVRARADVLRARGVLLRRVGRVEEAVGAYAEAIAIYRKTGARRQEARAKNALAYAMIVLSRYEDAIALALESIRLDLAAGGLLQLAKTLSNIGQAYARLGDTERALAYLKRARESHVRYGDRDGLADTLLVTASVHLWERNDVAAAAELVDAAEEHVVRSASPYDATHLAVVRTLLARARHEPELAIHHALDARRISEAHSLVSYHFYATALEAACRVDAAEVHSGTLLATTAMGAVDALQGCEFGLEVRALCADALKRAGSPQAALIRQKVADHARTIERSIHDPRLRAHFRARPLVAGLCDEASDPPSSERGRTLAVTGLEPATASLFSGGRPSLRFLTTAQLAGQGDRDP